MAKEGWVGGWHACLLQRDTGHEGAGCVVDFLHLSPCRFFRAFLLLGYFRGRCDLHAGSASCLCLSIQGLCMRLSGAYFARVTLLCLPSSTGYMVPAAISPTGRQCHGMHTPRLWSCQLMPALPLPHSSSSRRIPTSRAVLFLCLKSRCSRDPARRRPFCLEGGRQAVAAVSAAEETGRSGSEEGDEGERREGWGLRTTKECVLCVRAATTTMTRDMFGDGQPNGTLQTPLSCRFRALDAIVCLCLFLSQTCRMC